jgi:DNA-binding transcriptional regulator YhcF (GntR family)
MHTASTRIAAELRRRISAGELAPGDRVPSTRQIVADWGVAMATASKALAVLRQEGLVVAVPGVGTVVAGNDAPARSPGLELTADRIARMAIMIADLEGLGAVSMRRIATELGIATMSLYRHIPNREKLTNLMADTVIGDHPLPARPRGDWRAQLETVMRLQWAVYRRHPWLAQTISMARPQFLPNLVTHAEWSLRALAPFNLPTSVMLHTHITAFSFVRATALSNEAELEARRDTGLTGDEWMELQHDAGEAIRTNGRYPVLAKLIDEDDFELDFDELFEFGMRALLDGIAVSVRSAASPSGTRKSPPPPRPR